MSVEIQWGAEIAVNGVRPDWLRDEERVAFHDGYNWYGCDDDGISSRVVWIGKELREEDYVSSIRLPADHPYYLATSRGFTYWPGGESAPADWNGGGVLRDDGEVTPVYGSGAWDGNAGRAIGYRKRTKQPAPAIDPALVERMVALVRQVGEAWPAGFERHTKEARDILKALEPVDEDLVQARQLARDVLDGPEQSVAFLKNITDGHNDLWPEVRIALAAIKRGRELERERGEAGR